MTPTIATTILLIGVCWVGACALVAWLHARGMW